MANLTHGLETVEEGSVLWRQVANQNFTDLDPLRVIDADTTANRPSAGTADRFYYSTDDEILYYDNGATWTAVGTLSTHTHTLSDITDSGTMAEQDDGSVDINGGNIDGTPIGANSASTGQFTTIQSSGLATLGGGFASESNSSVTGTLNTTSTLTVNAGGADITGNSSVTGTLDVTSTLSCGAFEPSGNHTWTDGTANVLTTVGTLAGGDFAITLGDLGGGNDLNYNHATTSWTLDASAFTVTADTTLAGELTVTDGAADIITTTGTVSGGNLVVSIGEVSGDDLTYTQATGGWLVTGTFIDLGASSYIQARADVLPQTAGVESLGTSSTFWGEVWADDITANNAIECGNGLFVTSGGADITGDLDVTLASGTLEFYTAGGNTAMIMNADGNYGRYQIQSFNNNGDGGGLWFLTGRGTEASRQAAQDADECGRLNFALHNGSGWGFSGRMFYVATENQTTSARGGKYVFQATDNGSTTLQDVFEILGNGNLVQPSPSAPASAGATGTAGEIAWDSSYLYICTATDTWRRIAHATW